MGFFRFRRLLLLNALSNTYEDYSNIFYKRQTEEKKLPQIKMKLLCVYRFPHGAHEAYLQCLVIFSRWQYLIFALVANRFFFLQAP